MASALIGMLPAVGSLAGDIFGFGGAGRAAGALSQADIAAMHGVLDATKAGQAGLQQAVGQGRTDLQTGLQTGIGDVQTGMNRANTTLGGAINSIVGNVSPYMQAGNQGITGLMQYAQQNPQFSFDNPQQWMNSPAYQWQLQQGLDAIQNSAAGRGLGVSGNTLKDLTQYGQGLASTYYNDAFNRALQTYQTNRQSTLGNLTTLIGAGQFGAQQANQAQGNLGAQQAANQMGAGQFGGQANLSIGNLLANLGLGGAEDIARLGLQGATTAGNFGSAAGAARGAGILGQGNAFSRILGGLTDGGDGGGGLLGAIGSIPGLANLNSNPAGNVGSYAPSPGVDLSQFMSPISMPSAPSVDLTGGGFTGIAGIGYDPLTGGYLQPQA